jgi:type II secretory pathway pseudopilin PulG
MKVKLEKGFSYIDVMIAVVVLLVGILALLSAITGAVFQSRGQEQQLNAKQVATSTMESIMSVKETTDLVGQLGWIRIGNVGSNPNAAGANQGIFVTGFQNVRTDAGPDEVIGTADDAGAQVPGFQRRIVITDECDATRPSFNCVPVPAVPFPVKIRSVQVTVTYFVGTVQRQEVLTTVLTDYAFRE